MSHNLRLAGYPSGWNKANQLAGTSNLNKKLLGAVQVVDDFVVLGKIKSFRCKIRLFDNYTMIFDF